MSHLWPIKTVCRSFLTTGLSILLLAGCATIASVDMVPPPVPVAFGVNQSNEEIKQARLEINAGDLLAQSNPGAAMAKSETAAMLSLDALKDLSGRRSDEALELYNYSVARLVEEIRARFQNSLRR
jgi:uncharacterized lipoprotein YajG